VGGQLFVLGMKGAYVEGSWVCGGVWNMLWSPICYGSRWGCIVSSLRSWLSTSKLWLSFPRSHLLSV